MHHVVVVVQILVVSRYATCANGGCPKGCIDTLPAANASELIRTFYDMYNYMKILKPIVDNITKNRLLEVPKKSPELPSSYAVTPFYVSESTSPGRPRRGNAIVSTDAKYSCHECDRCPKISRPVTCVTEKGCGTMVYDATNAAGRKRNRKGDERRHFRRFHARFAFQ